ncbi:hypothetical protein ACWEQ1_32100 [Streptomyces nodosus]
MERHFPVGGAGGNRAGEVVGLARVVAVGQGGEFGAGPGAGDDGGHPVGGDGLAGSLSVALRVVGVDEEGLDSGPAAGDWHFVHFKIMTWAAIDRTIRLAEAGAWTPTCSL